MDPYMTEALFEARRALEEDEVPVGAVIVKGGKIIARGHNRRMQNCDPTAHAEIEAIRAAAQRLGDWRLDGCTMFVTLEPCVMCAGAIAQSRIDTVIFGAFAFFGVFSPASAILLGGMSFVTDAYLIVTCFKTAAAQGPIAY